jgi:hypothetical protein
MSDVCNQIISNLYLGNIQSPRDYGTRCSLIVNCTPDIPVPQTCNNFIRLPVWDTPEEATKLYNYINETNVLEIMHEKLKNKENVLVHCFAGAQRSCAIVACYLITYYKITPTVVIEFIKSRRRVAFFGGSNFIQTINMVYDDVCKKKIFSMHIV